MINLSKETIEIIKADTEKVFPKAVEIRRHIHMHPELGEEEKETAACVAARLDELGIPHIDGVGGGYGIVGQIGHGSKAVGIRADMDALPITEETGLEYASCVPGKMHACGHDVHTASLLAIAELLKSKEDLIDAAGGAVKLFFQPSEETIGGADAMIKDGCMKNPDVFASLGFHVAPTQEVGTAIIQYGPMNAAVQDFQMTVHGIGCHGAHPDLGVDPIVIASQIIGALQTISSRVMAPTTPIIVTVGSFNAGDAMNVIPDKAVLGGTIRSFDLGIMEDTKARVERISSAIAESQGGRVEFDWNYAFFPPLINDAPTTQVVEDCAKALLGEEKVLPMGDPSMGADDFAFFSTASPGTYINVGCTSPGAEIYSIHNSHFAPDEDCIKVAISVISAAAFELLGIK